MGLFRKKNDDVAIGRAHIRFTLAREARRVENLEVVAPLEGREVGPTVRAVVENIVLLCAESTNKFVAHSKSEAVKRAGVVARLSGDVDDRARTADSLVAAQSFLGVSDGDFVRVRLRGNATLDDVVVNPGVPFPDLVAHSMVAWHRALLHLVDAFERHLETKPQGSDVSSVPAEIARS